MKNLVFLLAIIVSITLTSCNGDTRQVDVEITEVHITCLDSIEDKFKITANCRTIEGSESKEFVGVIIKMPDDEKDVLIGKISGTKMMGTLFLDNEVPRNIERVVTKRCYDTYYAH